MRHFRGDKSNGLLSTSLTLVNDLTPMSTSVDFGAAFNAVDSSNNIHPMRKRRVKFKDLGDEEVKEKDTFVMLDEAGLAKQIQRCDTNDTMIERDSDSSEVSSLDDHDQETETVKEKGVKLVVTEMSDADPEIT